MSTADEMLGALVHPDAPHVPEVEQARRHLLAAGLTGEQLETVTGFGRRHGVSCQPDDLVLHKYAAGALSLHGVMGVVFGTDSLQHHRGHNVDPGRVGSVRVHGLGDGFLIGYMAGSDSWAFGVWEDVCRVDDRAALMGWLRCPPVWFGDPVAAVLKAREVGT